MSDRTLQSVDSSEISRTGPLGEALLALNNVHAQELSWLEPERLRHLLEEAFLARRIGNLDAFMCWRSIMSLSKPVTLESCLAKSAAAAMPAAQTATKNPSWLSKMKEHVKGLLERFR